MKAQFILLAAWSLIIVSCGGNKTKTTEATDTTAHDHMQHENTQVKVDTVVIKEGQEVYFVKLTDGQTVSSPLKVEMGVKGMEVEPMGAVNADKGHHHLIIDGSFVRAGMTTPADSTHIHYGKGQTETEIALPKGKHTLTLQFADGMHTSYGQRMSKTITVEVK